MIRFSFIAVAAYLSFVSSQTGFSQTNPPATEATISDPVALLKLALAESQQYQKSLQQDLLQLEAITKLTEQMVTDRQNTLANIKKSTEGLVSAQASSQTSLSELEAKTKTQKEALDKLRDELKKLQGDDEASKASQKKLAEKEIAARKSIQEAQQLARQLDQAIGFNQQRRLDQVGVISQLEANLVAQQAASSRIDLQIEELTSRKKNQQSDLDRFDKDLQTRSEELDKSLKGIQEQRAKVQVLANQIGQVSAPTVTGGAKLPESNERPLEGAAASPAESAAKEKTADQEPTLIDSRNADPKQESETTTKGDSPEAAAESKTEPKSTESEKSESSTDVKAWHQGLTELSKAHDDVRKSAQSVAQMIAQKTAIRSAISITENELKQLDEAKQDAAKRLEQAKEEIVTAKGELEKLVAATELLRKKLADTHQKIEEGVKEIEVLRDDPAQSAKEAGEGSPKSLELKAKQTAVSDGESEHAETQKNIAGLQEKLKAIEQAVQYNQSQLKVTQQQLETAEAISSLRKRELEGLKTDVAAAAQTMETLAAALKKLEQKS